MEVLDNDGDAEREANNGEEQGDEAEKLEWAVVLEECANHRDDFNTVADRV